MSRYAQLTYILKIFLGSHVLLYAGAHLGDCYCMDITFWYSGIYTTWGKAIMQYSLEMHQKCKCCI